MSEHRWSGWPGAWCLDCGCDDPMEVALADGWNMEGVVPEKYRIGPCTEPGSQRHDPYSEKARAARALRTSQDKGEPTNG